MKIKKITYSLSVITLLMTSLQATSLKEVVEHTIKNNQDIVSKSLNNDAFKKYIDEQKGGYYPKVDLTGSIGVKDEQIKLDNGIQQDTSYKGGNVQLDLEQMLYDGNLTPSSIEEAKARYSSNKLKNSNDVENILFDSISAYLNILKFDERISISEDNLSIHEDYLGIASQTEKINGEILDKVQTKAKIHSAKSGLFVEQNNKNSAESAFLKNVGIKIEGNLCRPIIDESKIPNNLEVLYKSVLENNYQILEQIENIKEQRAVISKEKAAFLPTLKFKVQSVYDKGLSEDEAKTNLYSGKLELKYNIFNGMINDSRTQREELFLKEVQAKLDTVTKSVLDEVTVAYETYNISKKQITELKQLIEENKQIIEIYKDQFDAGTRNFIDVLNVEGDLYNAKISLINTEYTMYASYYQLLKANSNLQNTVSTTSQQICEDSKPITKSNDISIQELLKEDNLNEKVNTQSTVEDEYVLFLGSYKDSTSADKVLNNISSSLENNIKVKKIENTNGFYTIALYNINGLTEANLLKVKYSSKYPSAYYLKKKK